MRIGEAVVVAALAAMSQQAFAGNDGNTLIQECRKAIDFIDSKPLNNSSDYIAAGHCIGMADGVITTASITNTTPPGPNQICLPQRISPYQAVRIVYKHMNDHPDMLGDASAVIMYTALYVAFPCKTNK